MTNDKLLGAQLEKDELTGLKERLFLAANWERANMAIDYQRECLENDRFSCSAHAHRERYYALRKLISCANLSDEFETWIKEHYSEKFNSFVDDVMKTLTEEATE